jgi:hypothetical protein
VWGFELSALDMRVAPSVLPGLPKSGRVADELSVDGVGEASFVTAQRFSVALAGGAFSSAITTARVSRAIWVMALVCRQQLSWRSPARESRCRVTSPEDAVMGAVPV